MRVLELFSGTKSVGKCCDKLGWESISVDLILPADHQVDIMEFDYKQYPKDHFDIVWGSPPCVSYSKLQSGWLGRKRKGVIFTKEIWEEEMNEADKLVKKTLEIIEYFNPELWFMENPQTGNLKNRTFMKDIPFYDVDYCKYSDWGYRKRTRIWTNKVNWNNFICHNDCENMIDKLHLTNLGNTERNQRTRHKVWAQGDPSIKRRIKDKHRCQVVPSALGTPGSTKKLDRYRVPEDLIFSLFLE